MYRKKLRLGGNHALCFNLCRMPEKEKDVYRMTVSLPMKTYEALEAWAFAEGRRASNLAAHLIEKAIAHRDIAESQPEGTSPKKPLLALIEEHLETVAQERNITPEQLWQQIIERAVDNQ